ncbi:hypothetical protein P4S91_26730 [Aneurinibacillus aneurinilyticus]|uniref:hypothetical protein n=1 Tax=Aneurinibacillus aneurinilyticus TaxID=1391 RepID=UPI002E20D38A|nr:hypothetical protein [Aneurinibacillus aneurinilyticus]MED0726436.1 hypothetical protein [Aneurinibacillus aneurinilyticus]
MRFTSSTILKAYIAFFFSFVLYGAYKFYIELTNFTAMYPEDKRQQIIHYVLRYYLDTTAVTLCVSIAFCLFFVKKNLKKKVTFAVSFSIGLQLFLMSLISIGGYNGISTLFGVVTLLVLILYLWRRLEERKTV